MSEPRLLSRSEPALSLLPEQLARAALDDGSSVEILLAPGRALASAGRQPFLAGSFETLSPGEVLALLYQGLRTGVLVSRQPAAFVELHFRDGEIAAGSTSDRKLRLGPVLVAHGWITAAAFAELEPLVGPGKKLGKLLTERGLLDAAALYRAVVLQVEEMALELLSWDAGTFLFVEGELPPHSALRLARRTRQLCVEGARRKLGRPSAALPAAPPPEPPRHGPFETYRRIFHHIHGALRERTGIAQEALNSFFIDLPPTYAAVFAGISFDREGELPVERVLAQAERLKAGPVARARALEALEALLSFALFEARNALPPEAAEQLLREVGRLQMRGEP